LSCVVENFFLQFLIQKCWNGLKSEPYLKLKRLSIILQFVIMIIFFINNLLTNTKIRK
jgi:hypothetical protein